MFYAREPQNHHFLDAESTLSSQRFLSYWQQAWIERTKAIATWAETKTDRLSSLKKQQKRHCLWKMTFGMRFSIA